MHLKTPWSPSAGFQVQGVFNIQHPKFLESVEEAQFKCEDKIPYYLDYSYKDTRIKILSRKLRHPNQDLKQTKVKAC